MAEVVPQAVRLIRAANSRSGDDEWIPHPAAVGVLLVTLEWRVRGHRPAPRKIGMGVGATYVVDAGDFVLDRLFDHVVGTHCIDESLGTSFLAGAIVGQRHDNRVVELA